jgi:hypothetical protein
MLQIKSISNQRPNLDLAILKELLSAYLTKGSDHFLS